MKEDLIRDELNAAIEEESSEKVNISKGLVIFVTTEGNTVVQDVNEVFPDTFPNSVHTQEHEMILYKALKEIEARRIMEIVDINSQNLTSQIYSSIVQAGRENRNKKTKIELED